MKFYLSSYKIGSEDSQAKFKNLLGDNKKAAYISNGLDLAPSEAKKKHEERDIRELNGVGLQVEQVDLRNYFGKKDDIRVKLTGFGVFYLSGGNVYDLRIAMNLSGLDEILLELVDSDIIYSGYSAVVCVLSPTLKGYHIIDDPNKKTYGNYDTIWKGLGFISWQFAPHFNSDHEESEDINKEVAYYTENDMPYKTLADGDVIILQREELDGPAIMK